MVLCDLPDPTPWDQDLSRGSPLFYLVCGGVDLSGGGVLGGGTEILPRVPPSSAGCGVALLHFLPSNPPSGEGGGLLLD